MKILKLISLFVFPFFLLSCGGGSYLSESDILNELKVSRLPVQADYPEDDAVMLIETHDLTMEITSNYDIVSKEKVHKVLKLFKNIEDNADVKLYIHSGETLDYISARTIKQDGSVVELKGSDFYQSIGMEGENTFHSDVKTMKFTFPAIEKNCMIEYEYVLSKDFAFFTDVWNIQHTYPTLLNRYNLTVPALLLVPEVQGGAGWNWRYRFYNIELPEPVVEDNINPQQMLKSKTLTYKWEVKNIKGFKDEPSMPSWKRYLQYVKFAPSDWNKWNDISEWYYNRFFKTELLLTNEINEKAASLTKGVDDELEKIKKIYNYVQNIRYVAIQLGDGSIRPTKPAEVLRREYGDCKDKSILLISLLKAAGINSKPVLMLTSDEGWFDAQFPSWNFNHMIAKVELENGKPLWLDATSKYCPVGMLPSACEGIDVLVMNEDGKSKIEKTSSSSFNDNLTEMNIDIDYKAASEAVFNVNYIFKGQRNISYRYLLTDKSDEDMKKFCKSLIEDEFLSAEIIDYNFSPLDSVEKPFEFNFKFRVPDAVQFQGDLALLNIDPFKLFSDMSWISKEKRIFNIEFNYPLKVEKKFSIRFPQNKFTLRNLPEKINITGNSVAYSKNFSQADDKINAEETFEIRKKEIPVRDYKKLRESFNKIQMKMKEKLILTKS